MDDRYICNREAKDPYQALAGAVCEMAAYDYVSSYLYVLMNQMEHIHDKKEPWVLRTKKKMVNDCLEFFNGEWILMLTQNENFDKRKVIDGCNARVIKKFSDSAYASRRELTFWKPVVMKHLNERLQQQRIIPAKPEGLRMFHASRKHMPN